MNDYERVSRVIQYLAEHQREQPSLETLAKTAGLSRFHFHRLFSNWAGVTPKDFLQCLTVTRVKELLRNGESTLTAAFEAGLSSPGRLHDLCVSVEAASPGELKFGGEGWKIVYGFAATPFGECLIAESPRGICHLAFIEPHARAAEIVELQQAWPHAQLKRNDSAAKRTAAAMFQSPQPNVRPTLRAFVRGTAFQLRVWRALLHVQPGSLITYGRLAAAIGRPESARAVGSAVAQNALAFLIPCHRVIRESGVLGEYRWNPARKRAMVAWESSRSLASSTNRPAAETSTRPLPLAV